MFPVIAAAPRRRTTEMQRQCTLAVRKTQESVAFWSRLFVISKSRGYMRTMEASRSRTIWEAGLEWSGHVSSLGNSIDQDQAGRV